MFEMTNFILLKRKEAKVIPNFSDIKAENMVLGLDKNQKVVAYMIDFDISVQTRGWCPMHQHDAKSEMEINNVIFLSPNENSAKVLKKCFSFSIGKIQSKEKKYFSLIEDNSATLPKFLF